MAPTNHIVVARATVAEGVKLELEDIPVTHVTAGQAFSLGMAYRLYESSAQKDEWKFGLAIEIDGETRLNQNVIQDRPFLRDDQWSNVSQEITLEAGEHEVVVTASAALGRSDWGNNGPTQLVATAEETMTLTIVAR